MESSIIENAISKMTADEDVDSDGSDLEEQSHSRLMNLVGINSDEEMNDKYQDVRTEAVADISVFNINSTNITSEEKGDKLSLYDLTKGLNETVKSKVLKKQLDHIDKSKKILNAPLSKVATQRIEQKIAHEKTVKNVTKWEPIVQNNRKAETLSFPLTQVPLTIPTIDEQLINRKRKFQSPLEEEIFALLNKSNTPQQNDSVLDKAKEEAFISLSYEEAKLRRAEQQKHRALKSYHETKLRRHAKIKSKAFARIRRKKKEREAKKNEDGSSDNNLLENAIRQRAEERASLRHRKGSKWAKGRSIMAKHDDTTRLELQQQLEKHKELVQKPIESDDEANVSSMIEGLVDEQEENVNETPDLVNSYFHIDIKGNPWISSTSKSPEVKKDDGSGTTKNTKADITTDSHFFPSDVVGLDEVVIEKESVSNPKGIDGFKEAVKKLEKEQLEDDIGDESAVGDAEESVKEITKALHKDSISKPFDISTLETSQSISKFVERLDGSESEDGDTFDDQRMTIAQAFADDDVISEFSSLKQKDIDENRPKVVDLTLPGWGEWGGVGIAVSKKKKRKFRIKQPALKKRKDAHLGHVIMNEKRDVSFTQHQVNSVPFPFTSNEQFERSIARPTGTTWNPPSVVADFIKPSVTTKKGAIIEPMHPDVAKANKEKKLKQILNKKNNQKNKKKVSSK